MRELRVKSGNSALRRSSALTRCASAVGCPAVKHRRSADAPRGGANPAHDASEKLSAYGSARFLRAAADRYRTAARRMLRVTAQIRPHGAAEKLSAYEVRFCGRLPGR
ncbi:hypothetical protein DQG23_34015 [Paenibacillus contaminans]|uniref:Uncharacterized protein n=1 Tax=Paenibacillus contaminans TaxID=450362 RepID=A0A329M068_9BACL|nr:hypothetical protein DQG23_34015 [Paenibacillus contaminans]